MQSPPDNFVNASPLKAAGDVTCRHDGTVANWNEVMTSKPLHFFMPKTLAELQEIIRSYDKVRFIGSGHSANGGVVADHGSVLVQMNGLHAIEPTLTNAAGEKTVWIEAGATIAEISANLSAQGLALQSLPTSEKITLGGALANGVHGSGWSGPGTVAEQVTGLEVVDGNGNLRRMSDDELATARIGLGLLGCAHRVQMKVVPDFRLVSTSDVVDEGIDAFAPTALRQTLSAHEHVIFLYDPVGGKTGRRFLDHATAENVPSAAKEKTTYLHASEKINGQLYAINTHWVFGPIRNFLRKKIRAMGVAPQPLEVGWSALMFQGDYNMLVRDMAYGVPVDEAQAVLKRISEEFAKVGYQPTFPIAVRCLGATDKTKLGLNSGRQTAVIELGVPGSELDFEKGQRAMEKVMSELSARPHWGKEFHGNPRASFPAKDWQDFADLSRNIGGDKFINEWARTCTPLAP